MSCRICRKKEKGAEPDSVYICSTCIGILGSMPRSEARIVVDKLYLADRAEDAQFVEKIITGGNSSVSETPMLKKRTIPIKIRKR